MALTKITTSLVAVNTLTAANIADNTIDATKIAQNQILARHIASGALSDAVAGISSSADATAITITSSETVGIGETTPLGILHVKDADSGAGTPNESANTLVLEEDDNCGISIFSGNNDNGMIAFGDSGDADIGSITYDHNTDALNFIVNASQRHTISSTGAAKSTINSDTDYSSTGEPAGILTLYNSNGSDGTGVNNYSSLEFNTGDGATSQGFINYVRTADNQGKFTFSQRTGSSSYAESMSILNDGTVYIGNNTDTQSILGRTAIGFVTGLSDYAYVGHLDVADSGGYALVQSAAGATFLNAEDGQDLSFSIHGTRKMVLDDSGNLGVARTDPSRPLDVKLTATNASLHNNSTAAVHFGSQGNTDGYIQGISLGYKTDGANTYAKTAIVARGLGDGAARQSLAFLVDTAADSGSAEIGDAKLLIDGTTGAVTMAKQPAFRAYLGTSTAVSAGTANFYASSALSEDFDRGGNFNASTGKFTAPHAGIYHFNATITMGASTAAVEYLSAEIVATPSGGSATRYVCGGWNSKPTGDNAYASSAGSVTIELAANAEVTLGYEVSDAITLQGGIGHCGFSGFLVA